MTPTQGEHAQPEALRLADSIEHMDTFTWYQRDELFKAAAELRRLHAQVSAQPAAPGVQADLRQVLLDPENQPNQYGVQFLMHGRKMAFKIGSRQFALDYEPDEPGEFEFMRDALIDAFSVFTHGVKSAQPAAPQGGAYAELPAIDWSQAGLLMEAHATTRQFVTGTTNWAAAICRYMTERASHGQAPAGAAHDWIPFSKRMAIADRHGIKVTAEFNSLVRDIIRTYLDTHNPTAQPAPAATPQQEPVAHDEDLLERLYLDFDSQRKKTGEERLAFKGKMRSYASEFRRRSAGKRFFAQSVSDDMMNLADRLGALPYVDPRAWEHLLVYAPHRWDKLDAQTCMEGALEIEALRAARTQADSVTAPAAGAVAGLTSDLHPEKCPITGRPFFMTLDHPELGRVPTYGGPYDSYTIPAPEGEPTDPWHERELRSERYDHDAGWWVEGGEPIPLRIVHEDVLFKLQEDAEAAAAPTPAAPHPIAPDVAADLERSDWTPEEALRWYAAGKHYDTVPNGDGSSSARILDNGAVASNALKSLSLDYAEHKGDVALMETPAAGAVAGWKWVPVKPTQSMCEAMTGPFIAINGDNRSAFSDAYQAMLAAAPTPAAQGDALIEALEIGLECAQQVAAEYHEAYKGHRPDTHAALDADVEKIKAALAAALAQKEVPHGN